MLKYARDKALRLMLPEPKGSYESVGEKICHELAHFTFADALKSKGYELTDAGKVVLAMLNEKKNRELRRTMALVHLQTYGNLWAVVHSHIVRGCVFSPSVEGGKASNLAYVAALLRPTFESAAEEEAANILERNRGQSAKKLEDALRGRVLEEAIEGVSIGVPLFRSMCDRLISLRLLNVMKTCEEDGEFAKSYSPCLENETGHRWHKPVDVRLPSGGGYRILLSEPDMNDRDTACQFLDALNDSFNVLKAKAGYFDLPDVRDYVCERLMIPEPAFDEGINVLLDRRPPPITMGLAYEGITGRRKPLVRIRETTQIFNLLRSA